MNKDLDERLVPNGEYRDALNIQIATTEGSDIGSAQTLLSNVQLTDWITSGQNAFFTNVPTASNFTEPNIMARSHAKAETIGIFADDNNNKVYNFISEANSTYIDETPDGSFYNINGLTDVPSDGNYNKSTVSGSGFIYENLKRELGIKCDVICEYDFGVNPLVQGSLKPVVVDVFEARHAPRFLPDKTNPTQMNPPMSASAPNFIKGLATVTYKDSNNNTKYAPAGIREGMVVQKVRPDGVNVWGQFPDIIVTEINLNSSQNNADIKISNLAEGQEIYTQQDINEGFVLVFTSPRVLNFKQSIREKETTYDEYNVETIGSESPTPNGNIITGINLIDDLLFFTDGRNEPKKINIERFKNGSKGFLDHTRIVFPTGDQVLGTYIREQHTTAIKINPKKAPRITKLTARTTGNPVPIPNTSVNYESVTSSVVRKVVGAPSAQQTTNFSLDGGIVGSEFSAGQNLLIKAEVNRVFWKPGDVIEVSNFGVGARFKIIATEYIPGQNQYSIFLISFLEYTSTYSAPGPSGAFFAQLVTKEGIYKNQFVKLAMRYKYLDNEYSCISPYSNVIFKPGGYGFNAEVGWNPGMENRVDSFVIHDFVSSDIPEDVKEVEILYRESSGFPAVYSAAKIKADQNPNSKWNKKYQNPNKIDSGQININQEIFGNILPTNQLDRTYDALPKKAKAQELVASRVLYGNYTENYNLIDDSGSVVNGNFSLQVESFNFPFLSVDFAALTSTNYLEVGLPYLSTDPLGFGFPRHGIELLNTNYTTNGSVNYLGGDNRPFDNSDFHFGWASSGNNKHTPPWYQDTSLYPTNPSIPLSDFEFGNAAAGSLGNSTNGVHAASNLPKLIHIPFTNKYSDPNNDFLADSGGTPQFRYSANATGSYTFELSATWKNCYTHGYILGPTMYCMTDMIDPDNDVTANCYSGASYAEGKRPLNPYYVPVFRPAPAAIQLHYVDDDGNPTIPSGKTSSLVLDTNGNPCSSDPRSITLVTPNGSIEYGSSQSGIFNFTFDNFINGGQPEGNFNNIYRKINLYDSNNFINTLNNSIWNRWAPFCTNLLDARKKIPLFPNISSAWSGEIWSSQFLLGSQQLNSQQLYGQVGGFSYLDVNSPGTLGNHADGITYSDGTAGIPVVQHSFVNGGTTANDGTNSPGFLGYGKKPHLISWNLGVPTYSRKTTSSSIGPDRHENFVDYSFTGSFYARDKFLYSPHHMFDDVASTPTSTNFDNERVMPYSHAKINPTVDLVQGERVALFYRAWDFKTDLGVNQTYSFLDKHPAAKGGLFRQKVIDDFATNGRFYDADADSTNDTWRTDANGEPLFQFSCNWSDNENYYGTPQLANDPTGTFPINNNVAPPVANPASGSNQHNGNLNKTGIIHGLHGFNVLAVDRILNQGVNRNDAGKDFSPSFRQVDDPNNGWGYHERHGVNGAGYYLNIIPGINGTNNNQGNDYKTRFKVTAAPSYVGAVPVKQGTESVHSDRNYEIGIVYCDKFGRESTVIIDEGGDYSSAINLPKAQSSQKNKIVTTVFNNAPAWADHYKFYVKEITPEYHNIVMHKAYDNNDDVFAWISFNSSDRNKIKEEDFIVQKKQHNSSSSVASIEASWKVLSISDGIPNGSDGNPIDAAPSNVSSGNIPIGGQDSGGKFFVKVQQDDAFDTFLGSLTSPNNALQSNNSLGNAAVFEVRPDFKTTEINEETQDKDKFGLFWEMSDGIPIKLDIKNAQQYIKVGSKFTLDKEQSSGSYSNGIDSFNTLAPQDGYIVSNVIGASSFSSGLGSYAWSGSSSTTNNGSLPSLADEVFCIVELSSSTTNFNLINNFTVPDGKPLIAKFEMPDGSYVSGYIADDIIGNKIKLKPYTQSVNGYYIPLKIAHEWFNCYCFGNGVESDRLRDDFNEKTLFPYTAIGKQSGFKASRFFDDYKEEHRPYDIIFSQLYNERTGVDQTNQFILADTITKRLNPDYGAITKLHSRNAIGSIDDVIAFCENKILKILASGKDALFNADGNSQLLASSRVLGQTIPFGADYGCQHPESFASDEYRVYFVDASKGAVLRLSRDGITPISGAGMSTWFYDNLNQDSQYETRGTTTSVIGSFDDNKQEYNITIHNSINPNWKKATYSLAYHEPTDGWVSFRSYVPEAAFSINNKYFTVKNGEIWGHSEESLATTYNKFYSVDYDSTVTLLFNDAPSSVKSFRTMSYEGTQSRVVANNSDGEYYNATSVDGWYVEDIGTDKQEGNIPEFIDKEGKWFNYIYGEATTHTNAADGGSNLNNLDFAEFSVQGLGNLSSNSTVVSGTTPALGFKVTPTLTLPSNTAFTVSSSLNSSLQNITTTPTQSFVSAFEITPSPGYTLNAASFGIFGNNMPTINNSSGTAVSPFNSAQSFNFTNSGAAGTPSNTVLVTTTFNNAITISSDQTLTIPITGSASTGTLVYEALVIFYHGGLIGVPNFTWNMPFGLTYTQASQTSSSTQFKISGTVQPNSNVNLFNVTANLTSSEVFSSPISCNYTNLINTENNYSSASSFNVLSNGVSVNYSTSSNDEFLSSTQNAIHIDLFTNPCSITTNQPTVIVSNGNSTISDPRI